MSVKLCSSTSPERVSSPLYEGRGDRRQTRLLMWRSRSRSVGLQQCTVGIIVIGVPMTRQLRSDKVFSGASTLRTYYCTVRQTPEGAKRQCQHQQRLCVDEKCVHQRRKRLHRVQYGGSKSWCTISIVRRTQSRTLPILAKHVWRCTTCTYDMVKGLQWLNATRPTEKVPEYTWSVERLEVEGTARTKSNGPIFR